MKKILTVINIVLLALLIYIMANNGGEYIKFLGCVICLASISLFGITEQQQVRSIFIIISVIFNPIYPLADFFPLSYNIVVFSLCILYNIYYFNRLRKGES